MKRSGMFVVLHRLVGRVWFWFFETFGERDIERTSPAHGDWKETCGWNFRGRFYPCDKTPNSVLMEEFELMGANAVRAVPTSGTAREAIRRDARGAKATPVSRAQRQTATAFNPSNNSSTFGA